MMHESGVRELRCTFVVLSMGVSRLTWGGHAVMSRAATLGVRPSIGVRVAGVAVFTLHYITLLYLGNEPTGTPRRTVSRYFII